MKEKTDVMPDKNSEEYKIRFGYPENEFVFCCNDDDTNIWVYHKSDSATFRQIDPGFSKANEKNFSRAVDYAMKTKKLAYFDPNILKHPIFSNTKEQIDAKQKTATSLALKIYEAVEIQKAVDAGKDMNELQEDMLWKSDLLAHKMPPEKCEILCKTTFLEKAVRRDFDKMVKFLLEKTNADVNAKNNMGITALFSCIRSAKMARLLIKYGADVNIKDEKDRTLLFYANRPEVIRVLLENGADGNIRDKFGQTALFQYLNADEIDMFLKYCGNVNDRDNDGKTPLFYAWRDVVVRSLLKHGADVNIKDNDGRTAIFYEGEEKIPLLVEHGADVNVKDKDGMTPLLMCIKNENLGNAAYLMEHGADFSVVDSDGKTILDNAKEIFEKMKKSFIDKGIDYSKNRSYNYNLKSLNKIQKIFGKANP